MKERTGYTFTEIVARRRSDRAARGVTGVLHMKEMEACEMHDTDKLGQAATGGLVRTRNKIPVNPFPEGVALISRAHKLGTYFGYSTRANDLEEVGKKLGNVPNVKIQVDYNTTRISAVHGLLYSEIRLNRGLKAYDLEFSPGWDFKAEDWPVIADFEAVLNATRQTATLSQVEKDFMAAFTCLIKSMALSKLRASTMQVIELKKVTASPKVLREEVSVINMSALGQKARFRATLEGERRWCGNEGETLTGAPVNMGRHEMLCMLLDKRTLGCHHVTVAQREEARTVFIEEYIKFYLQASKWDSEKLKEANDAAAAAAANLCQTVKMEDEGDSSSMASGNLFQGTTWSEDEDEEEGEDDDEVEEVAKETIAKEEAKRVLKAWKKYDVNWREMYPSLQAKAKDEPLDLTEDLMRLNVGDLYTHVEKVDTGRQLYGYIPLMASSSSGQLGALSAESYCERILSCANNVIVKGNTLLGDEELEMIVVLRMNREFMQFMREHYSEDAKQVFGETVVRDD
jgi:hypothetical protein